MSYDVRRAYALELLAAFPDSSVDLCATDPPYFRVKAAEWDRAWDTPAAFVAWLAEVVDEIARVLRPNGSLYLFASPQMSARVEVMIGERLCVLNRITWAKPAHATKAEMNPKEWQRCYFPTTESIIFAEHYGAASLAGAMRSARTAAGVNFSEAGRALRVDSRLPALWECERTVHGACEPTAEQFESAMHLYGRTGDLRREYEALRRPFHVTADDAYTDVWTFPTVSSYPGKHECEKPPALCDQIVRASGKPGGVLLDPFAGSGAMLTAGLRAGMDVIGGDADEHWARVARAACRNPWLRVECAEEKIEPGQTTLFEVTPC